MRCSFILLALLWSFLAQASCPESNPPDLVLKAFRQKFPTATMVQWDKESKTVWEAEFKLKDKKTSANFDNTGKWLETESEISFQELPIPAQNLLKGKKVKELARLEKAGGEQQFEAEIGHKEWMFDSLGNRLD